jgi:hypothetical protein
VPKPVHLPHSYQHQAGKKSGKIREKKIPEYIGIRLMGSQLLGSFGSQDQFLYDIQGLFGLNKTGQQKCVSVNGIIH